MDVIVHNAKGVELDRGVEIGMFESDLHALDEEGFDGVVFQKELSIVASPI